MFPLMVRLKCELSWELNPANSQVFAQTWFERTFCSREDELPLEKAINDNSFFWGDQNKLMFKKGSASSEGKVILGRCRHCGRRDELFWIFGRATGCKD